ncbi:hypothetical protein LINPERPRIM_LOCUS14603 [Linum perenne]
MVHSKRRNKLMQQKMNDLVFVKYNSRLISNQLKKKERLFDDIRSDDEWIAGDDEESDNEVVSLIGAGSTTEPNIPSFENILEQVSIII